jgi:hypothetical protein
LPWGDETFLLRDDRPRRGFIDVNVRRCSAAASAFAISGVYVLTISDDIRYVGDCTNLFSPVQHRLRKHLTEKLFQGWAGDQLPFE